MEADCNGILWSQHRSAIYSGHPWTKIFNILSNQVFTAHPSPSALLWASLSLASLLPTGPPNSFPHLPGNWKVGWASLSASPENRWPGEDTLPECLPTTVVTFPQLINFPFMGNPSYPRQAKTFSGWFWEACIFLSWEHSPTAKPGFFWIIYLSPGLFLLTSP